MKTITRVSLVLALIALPLELTADDDRMYKRGMGYGYHMMESEYIPCDDCGNYHRRGYYNDQKAMSEKKAREKFETFIKKHLKGYTITKMEKERMPMGTMYWVIVKDKNGNEMELHMNPWGYIRGPFVR